MLGHRADTMGRSSRAKSKNALGGCLTRGVAGFREDGWYLVETSRDMGETVEEIERVSM
jgi:hypothetical protein